MPAATTPPAPGRMTAPMSTKVVSTATAAHHAARADPRSMRDASQTSVAPAPAPPAQRPATPRPWSTPPDEPWRRLPLTARVSTPVTSSDAWAANHVCAATSVHGFSTGSDGASAQRSSMLPKNHSDTATTQVDDEHPDDDEADCVEVEGSDEIPHTTGKIEVLHEDREQLDGADEKRDCDAEPGDREVVEHLAHRVAERPAVRDAHERSVGGVHHRHAGGEDDGEAEDGVPGKVGAARRRGERQETDLGGGVEAEAEQHPDWIHLPAVLHRPRQRPQDAVDQPAIVEALLERRLVVLAASHVAKDAHDPGEDDEVDGRDDVQERPGHARADVPAHVVQLRAFAAHLTRHRPGEEGEREGQGEHDRRVPEGEEEPDRERALAVGHELAGGVVDGGDVVGVEGVAQAEPPRGEPDADPQHGGVPRRHDEEEHAESEHVQAGDDGREATETRPLGACQRPPHQRQPRHATCHDRPPGFRAGACHLGPQLPVLRIRSRSVKFAVAHVSHLRYRPRMSARTPAGQPDALAQLIRAAGMRLTPQRTLVVEALAAATPAHLSADEVWRVVADRYTGINRSTVYRVLEQLTAMGLVAQHRHGGSAARYELRRGSHHHHVRCSSCGAIADIEADDLAVLERRVRKRLGFLLADVGQTLDGLSAPRAGRSDRGRGSRRRPGMGRCQRSERSRSRSRCTCFASRPAERA